jgi:putative restriction endonuclease
MTQQNYENYWKLTNAFTDFNGEGFRITLKICVEFIDEFKKEKYSEDKYSRLQTRIEKKLKINRISIRKAINQLVKMGFIKPFLISYNFDSIEYINAKSNRKRQSILSKVVYSYSCFERAVKKESQLHHLNFLINTLVENGELSIEDITGLMLVDITKYTAGYLNSRELLKYKKEAIKIKFAKRKYNQVSYLCNLLGKLDNILFHKSKLYFKEDAHRIFGEELYRGSKKRNPYLHGIYKNLLYSESNEYFNSDKCMVERIAYPVLIASHIKPFIACNDTEAYDVNNGFLLSKNIDSLFDLGFITFDKNGKIVFSKKLPNDVVKSVSNYSLDIIFLNDKRKEYLDYHRKYVFEKRYNATA